jgi:hypothetical protein
VDTELSGSVILLLRQVHQVGGVVLYIFSLLKGVSYVELNERISDHSLLTKNKNRK